MCGVKGVDGLSFENSYSEILKKIKASNAEIIALTGGEPTLHPDILGLAKKIKELNFKGFIISSNGARFADEDFTKKMVDCGLKRVSLSLHGPKDATAKITRSDSFGKSISGIKNLLENQVDVRVVSILMNPNINYLHDLYNHLLDLDVSKVEILNINYEGRALKRVKDLAVSFTQKKNFFLENRDVLSKFSEVRVTEFPRCLLPQELPPNFAYLSSYGKIAANSYDSDMGGGVNFKEYRQVEICSRCRFRGYCPGLKKRDLKLFGVNDFKEAAGESSFLN